MYNYSTALSLDWSLETAWVDWSCRRRLQAPQYCTVGDPASLELLLSSNHGRFFMTVRGSYTPPLSLSLSSLSLSSLITSWACLDWRFLEETALSRCPSPQILNGKKGLTGSHSTPSDGSRPNQLPSSSSSTGLFTFFDALRLAPSLPVTTSLTSWMVHRNISFMEHILRYDHVYSRYAEAGIEVFAFDQRVSLCTCNATAD